MTIILTVVKWGAGLALLVWGVLAALDWIGPTVPIDLNAQFDANILGDDLDEWLAEQESAIPNLRDNAAKEIVWAGAKGERTDLAVIYIHGFSATREELRPLPDLVAEGLEANLFFTRLAGHGQDSAAMGAVTPTDWMADVAEALAIGQRLGDRVIVMGSSTGSTLAIAAAADPTLSKNIAGLALMSPNLGVGGIKGRALEWPFADKWGPMVVGDEHRFTPRNEAHGANWTTSYPSRILPELGALTHKVRNLDMGAMTVPAVFFVSNEDKVVDPTKSRRAAAAWGAPSELVPVVRVDGDDPSGHVMAGDILSPNKTVPIAERILAWARSL